MSSAFPSRRLSPQDGMDILFCHTCGHEWYRSSEDTSPPPSCQRCHQDIVEIVTRENDPRAFQQTINSMFSDTPFNLGGLGSAGPSHRMPSSQQNPEQNPDNNRERNREHSHGNAHNDTLRSHSADDEDDFSHSFHDQLHRQFHDQIHARAHAQAMRNHHFGNERDPHSFARGFDSDPEEADIEEHEYHAPNNLYMYRTITTNISPSDRQQPQQAQASSQQSGAGTRQRPGATEPSDAESVLRTFTQFLHGFRDSQAGRSGLDTLFSNNGQPGVFGSSRQTGASNNTTFGATSFTIATGPMRPGQTGGATDFNTVLGNILGNIGPPDIEEQNPRGAAGLPPGFPALHQIVLAVLSRDGNFQHGDAVHSDEALDRIITMLMESNQQSSGAPPASQNALDELERKKVDESMLGSEGHAECTICITEVELNEEVLLLPCKHWFHEECVVMWLKQHNTCPVCRNPVVQKNSENADRSPHSAAGPGPTAGGSSSTSRNEAGRDAAGGGSGTNSGTNTDNGNSIFGGALNGLNLPRALFAVNITGSGNRPGAAWGPGIADPGPGRSSNTPGADPVANAATGTSSSATPHLQMPSLRQRANAQERASAQERLNAIRSAAGLPPTTASVNTNTYRSPRVSERSAAAAERERRRRDSHSPNPGHNIPSRRYNSSFAPEFDDWGAAGPDFTASRSSNWSAPTQNNSYRRHFGGAVGSTSPGSGFGPSASRNGSNGEPSTWDRRWPSNPRRDSAQGSDSASGSMNPPSFGRPYGSWMPGGFSTQLGGDGHADAHAQEEPRSGAGGQSHSRSRSRSRSNSNSSNNTNSGSTNGNGGGGGLFGFFRRR